MNRRRVRRFARCELLIASGKACAARSSRPPRVRLSAHANARMTLQNQRFRARDARAIKRSSSATTSARARRPRAIRSRNTDNAGAGDVLSGEQQARHRSAHVQCRRRRVAPHSSRGRYRAIRRAHVARLRQWRGELVETHPRRELREVARELREQSRLDAPASVTGSPRGRDADRVAARGSKAVVSHSASTSAVGSPACEGSFAEGNETNSAGASSVAGSLQKRSVSPCSVDPVVRGAGIASDAGVETEVQGHAEGPGRSCAAWVSQSAGAAAPSAATVFFRPIVEITWSAISRWSWPARAQTTPRARDRRAMRISRTSARSRSSPPARSMRRASTAAKRPARRPGSRPRRRRRR